MIPDDESVRRAMQRIEPAGTDVPDLFDRVAAGARRRRQQRSIGAVTAAAVVVAVVALVPALGGGGSSTKTGTVAVPGTAAASSPGVNSLPVHGEPPVSGPSSIASLTPVASTAQVVESPTPPLSSTPPTPPSLPIATGTCAPGISAAVQVGPARPVLVTPGAHTLHLTVGGMVTFTIDGGCAPYYFYWPTGDAVFGALGALLPGSVINPSSFGNDLTATATGTEVLSLRRQACDDGGSTCHSPTGSTLATITVTVSPATVIFSAQTPSASPTPLQKDASGCPTIPASGLAGDVNGTAAQEAAAFDAVAAVAQQLYGSSSSNGTVQVTAIYRAIEHTGFGIAADSVCGKALGDDSYVVELHIPNAAGSASIGSGHVFVAQFATGWRVWFRYH